MEGGKPNTNHAKEAETNQNGFDAATSGVTKSNGSQNENDSNNLNRVGTSNLTVRIPSPNYQQLQEQQQYQEQREGRSLQQQPQQRRDTRHRVYKLVLTGGPCAGKTTGQNRINDFFENLGWKVYRVPETANILLGGGVKFTELNDRDSIGGAGR